MPLFVTSTPAGRDGLDAIIDRLARSSAVGSEHQQIAADLITQVQQRGDAAIIEQMRQWTDPDFTLERMRVTDHELAAADTQLTGDLRMAIERSIAHVRQYQRHLLPRDAAPVTIAGAELGLRWRPIQPVGLLVPGGAAVLFSSLIMLAVPAIEAGVDPKRITVISPPPYRREGEPAGDVSPITLAVCRMLGIGKVYRIGGPAAVAALALGTETIDPVNFIAGPGHPVTQAAKMQLAGRVGVDGYLGASEIVTIADAAANPDYIAADLLAQAEHDPGKCFLIAWERDVIDRIFTSMEQQKPRRKRLEAIEAALADESCAVLVSNEDEAIEVANRIACEHVNLAVADPEALLARLDSGGEFFLGDATPVAAGDYYAGPSHSLPTGTTARYAGGVSVFTFLKRSGIVRYRDGMPPQAIDDIAAMAEAEGLDGHADSARIRR